MAAIICIILGVIAAFLAVAYGSLAYALIALVLFVAAGFLSGRLRA